MLRISQMLTFAGLVLATKIWIDVCEIWKHQIKMNTYIKISSCAVDIFKMLRQESEKNRRAKAPYEPL